MKTLYNKTSRRSYVKIWLIHLVRIFSCSQIHVLIFIADNNCCNCCKVFVFYLHRLSLQSKSVQPAPFLVLMALVVREAQGWVLSGFSSDLKTRHTVTHQTLTNHVHSFCIPLVFNYSCITLIFTVELFTVLASKEALFCFAKRNVEHYSIPLLFYLLLFLFFCRKDIS